MASNSGHGTSANQFMTGCSCGWRFLAGPEHVGKRVKCPKCAGLVVVQAPSPAPYADRAAGGISKGFIVAVVAVLVVAVGGMTLFLIGNARKQHEEAMAQANAAAASAISEAEKLIANGSAAKADQVERNLNAALSNENLTDKSRLQLTLDRFREHRESLAAKSRLQQSEAEAAGLLAQAKSKIEARQIPQAVAILKKYVDHPHASESADAARLMSECEAAVSDAIALDVLVGMNDVAFDAFLTSGSFDDGTIKDRNLVLVRNESLKRNLSQATPKRAEFKVAEAKRMESERALAMEQERQQEVSRKKLEEEQKVRELTKPLPVFLGGQVEGPVAAMFRQIPEPKMLEVEKKSGSVFDKAEAPKWASKFVVERILLAPGATMDIEVENNAESVFGQHSAWSWTIALVAPNGINPSRGTSFTYAVGNETQDCFFESIGSGQTAYGNVVVYRFREDVTVRDTLHWPIDFMLKRMVSEGDVKFRLRNGSPENGTSFDGQLSDAAVAAIKSILQQSKYKNWKNKPLLAEEWMKAF